MIHFVRLFYFCAFLYVLVSVLYTSVLLFYRSRTGFASLRLSSLLERTHDFSFTMLDYRHAGGRSTPRSPGNKQTAQETLHTSSFDSMFASSSVLHWPISGLPSTSKRYIDSFSRKSFLADTSSIALPESLFLSKAFSNSMHPMKIVPFFYRGHQTFDDADITVTTLVTTNRLHVLEKLAARYQGASRLLSSQSTKRRSKVTGTCQVLYL